MAPDLPRKTIDIEPAKEEQSCSECNSEKQRIGSVKRSNMTVRLVVLLIALRRMNFWGASIVRVGRLKDKVGENK